MEQGSYLSIRPYMHTHAWLLGRYKLHHPLNIDMKRMSDNQVLPPTRSWYWAGPSS